MTYEERKNLEDAGLLFPQARIWHDARLDPPPEGQRVLAVKQNKAGHRDYCFGSRWESHKQYGNDGWITGGGCNNVIYWMPLPDIPKD